MNGRVKFTKSVSGSFNDQQHIENYLQKGKFPAIHNDFAKMVKYCAKEKEPCFDLGSCIGLLAIRNIACGRSFCLGIEGNKFDFERAVKHKNTEYHNYYIDVNTFDFLIKDLVTYKPTLITARRVIYEIGRFDIKTVETMAEIFSKHGVKKIILQGCVPVKNPSVTLWNSELEINALSKYFKPIKKLKDVYMLCNI